jgi:hypothetical protein
MVGMIINPFTRKTRQISYMIHAPSKRLFKFSLQWPEHQNILTSTVAGLQMIRTLSATTDRMVSSGLIDASESWEVRDSKNIISPGDPDNQVDVYRQDGYAVVDMTA